jgi:phenylalanyl-tRNA synthetase beta chain
MKLSINWLGKYIDPKLSTEELIERLTMAGLEVEGVEYIGKDIVLELEITPNRPDCLNVLGLAREIGAITGNPVKNPKIKNFKTSPIKNIVHIEDKKECSRYIATLIRDVQIKDAPQDMRQFLVALGINAINNAVDITNFVLMETGQPLHAFDFDKLAGGKINVRRARLGESIITLDGVERKLDPSVLVIADAEKPVAIAGIMGGKGTEITSGTRNILLESAHFDMGLIRRACRSLGLRSDSSYRFERNVNFEGVLTGANRATDLLLQLAGGKLSGRTEIVVKNKTAVTKISLKLAEIESLLGLNVTSVQAKSWLSKLGFKIIVKKDVLTVSVPLIRSDITQSVDLIEEIARMVGFDHLPSKMPTIKAINIPVNKRPRAIKDQIRQILTAGGIDEIITHSMIKAQSLEKCNLGNIPAVRIFNPLTQDQELMRPAILPSLLQVAVTNINRGQKDLRFFEIGKIYSKDQEREVLGLLLTGRRTHDWRSSKKEAVDIFDIKGLLERIFQTVGINAHYEEASMSTFEEGNAAGITVDGKLQGVFGKISRDVLNKWDIKNQEVYYARLHLDEILSTPNKFIKYQPISEFPAIVRDVSLSVKKEIPYSKIETICLQQGGDILRSVQFIEQYLGDKIQTGYKGLVFSCQYQSSIRTLREDEVAAVHERILQTLIRDLAAIRR